MEFLVHNEIGRFVRESLDNRFSGGNAPNFDELLVEFASNSDSISRRYKTIIGDFHLTPGELFGEIFGADRRFLLPDQEPVPSYIRVPAPSQEEPNGACVPVKSRETLKRLAFPPTPWPALPPASSRRKVFRAAKAACRVRSADPPGNGRQSPRGLATTPRPIQPGMRLRAP